MARAVWSGSHSFGLVNIPVKVYPATRDHDVRFHRLDAKSGHRVRYQRVAEETGEPVDYKNVVKGYEVAPGEYVAMTDEGAAGVAAPLDSDH